jgi:AbrB family looped-hinge helix DNA binding protein
METAKLGKRGTLVIPAKLRHRFALKEGDLLVTEEREDGILLRPAVAVPVEIYTPARKAEFFLNNAVTKDDYDEACRIIREDFGLDPAKIPNTEDVNRDDLPSNREFMQQMKRIRANLANRGTAAKRRA